MLPDDQPDDSLSGKSILKFWNEQFEKSEDDESVAIHPNFDIFSQFIA